MQQLLNGRTLTIKDNFNIVEGTSGLSTTRVMVGEECKLTWRKIRKNSVPVHLTVLVVLYKRYCQNKPCTKPKMKILCQVD